MKIYFDRILDEYTIMTIENEEEKSHFVILNGQTEEISEEVYIDFIRYDSRERKRIERSKHCLTGKNIRCKGNCDNCEFYRIGKGPIGINESLDKLMEEYEFEVCSEYSLEEEITVKEMRTALKDTLESLSESEKRIIRMIVTEESAKEVAKELKIASATLTYRKQCLIEKIKKNILF